MEILKNKSITDVQGIKASGIKGGLKKSGKKDLCIFVSEGNPKASAVFTKNKLKAAPILLNQEHIKNQTTKAVVVNSGNANSCTGEQGLKDANRTAQLAADLLGIKKEEVLVQSTGIIGVPLKMDKLEKAIKQGVSELSTHGGEDASVAIMTTDTFNKEVAVKIELGGQTVTLAGMCKGSGMIHPNMATMLSFIVTDANIDKSLLDIAFKECIEDTFNMISVDGDTSTNDMAMVLANGLAENPEITEKNADYETFKKALYYVNRELSKLIACDGEGATKLIEVKVSKARTLEAAKLSAKGVITSSLVKCAFFGADANWGRIVCAIGQTEIDYDQSKMNIVFKNYDDSKEVQILKDGVGVNFDEELAKEILLEDKVKVFIDLGDGSYDATAWGCDLSYDYVKINGAYRT